MLCGCWSQPPRTESRSFARFHAPDNRKFIAPSFRPRGLSTTVGPVSVGVRHVSSLLGAVQSRTTATRAHSSIGQSPRLITGPFLVRTQVGPLARRHREPGLHGASPYFGFLASLSPTRPRVLRRARICSALWSVLSLVFIVLE